MIEFLPPAERQVEGNERYREPISNLGDLLRSGDEPVVCIMDFLRGEQILLALVSKAMLAQVKVGQNITEWGKIPLQRRSAILRLAGTTGQAGDTRA